MSARIKRVRSLAVTWLLRLLLLAVLVGAWLWCNRSGVSELVLPKLGDVLSDLGDTLTVSLTWSSVLLTMIEFLVATALAVLCGFVIGFIGSRTSLRSEVVEPLLSWGYMAPLELLFPIFTLWFGVGVWSKIFFGALAATFPIAINTLRGFGSVKASYINVGRAYGASNGQAEWLIKMPAAAPMILAGIRIGAALSMISVILGEMLSSQRGLGYELAKASQTFEPAHADALIIVLLAMVVVVHPIIQRFATPRHG
jgi:NitT/TauT family transport system permease protein